MQVQEKLEIEMSLGLLVLWTKADTHPTTNVAQCQTDTHHARSQSMKV